MRVIGDDPDDLRELIESFLEEAPALVLDLEAAAASMDKEKLRRAAHTLKASARDFGAPRLAELCEALEHSARDGPSEPAALVRSIAAEYAMAGRELKVLLDLGPVLP
jgi:HPt (histidine-containing phosphotransfer) domain-containing protein